MTKLLQPFIADALQRIAAEISDPQEEIQTPLKTTAEFVLDVSMAERGTGGSLVFPNTDGQVEPDWCVLAMDSSDGSRQTEVFRLRGRIRADAQPLDFVERAYELILLRQIDRTGREIYPELLEKFQLSRRDVLKILVESQEAQDRSVRYIIIPDPSSWLRQLGVGTRDDASFPSVTVKKAEM